MSDRSLTLDERQQLAASCLPAAYKWLDRNRWATRILGWDEAVSIAGLALVEAALRYDPGVAAFSTFALSTLHGMIRTAVRKALLVRGRQGVSLDDPTGHDEGTLADVVAAYEEPEPELYPHEVEALLAQLPEAHAAAVRLTVLEGRTNREAGEILGVTKDKIWILRTQAFAALAGRPMPGFSGSARLKRRKAREAACTAT